MAHNQPFQWRGEISINQVLAEIREDPMTYFWLSFVRSSGKEKGSIKTVAKCLYGAAMREGQVHEAKDTRKRAMHVDKGTLPMTDYENGHYLTPLISHIIGYNLYKVIH